MPQESTCGSLASAAECFAESTIDATTIRNVLLCGNRSRNGYDIPATAFGDEARVQALYEGRPVYANHPDPAKVRGAKSSHEVLAARPVQDLAGKIVNARLEQGKPYGDIETEGYPLGSMVLGLSKAKPKGVGLSHVAFYVLSESTKGSTPSIEIVKEVVSVDVVCGPATTNTFHESTKGHKQTMEVNELLQKQLDKAEAEKTALATETTAKLAELKTALESAETRTAELKGKLEAADAKIVTLEGTIAKHGREAEVRQALEAAGLDPADKDKVSPFFYESLLAENDATKRQQAIEDRAAIAGKSAPAGEDPPPAAESTKRNEGQADEFDVKAVLSGSIFTN